MGNLVAQLIQLLETQLLVIKYNCSSTRMIFNLIVEHGNQVSFLLQF